MDGAAADGHLVLARKVGKVAISEEVARDALDDLAAVVDLVGIDSSDRAAGDVTRDVAARADRGQVDRVDLLNHLGNRLDGEPVELDILARGDVGDVVAVVSRDLAEE